MRILHGRLFFLCLIWFGCLGRSVVHAAPAVLGVTADEPTGSSFDLSVLFDTAMDTNSKPVFSFPTDGEDVSSYLTLGVGEWVSDVQFVQHYAKQPDVPATDIDVAVDGARSTTLEAQIPYFQTDVFSWIYIPPPHVIDMKGSIEPDGTLLSEERAITDADVGKTIRFIVRFDIPTDYAGCGTDAQTPPCLNLLYDGGATPLSLQNTSATWLTRNRYELLFTIVDGDEQREDIDVTFPGGVIGRKDDSSTKAPEFVLADVFDIDTKNPTVVSVTSSTATISASTVAAGNLDLTVAFGEAMDPTSTPSLTFPNQDMTVLLTATTGIWSDDKTFIQSFAVNPAIASFAGVDVHVAGARDARGNLQVDSTLDEVFAVDLPSPTPTVTATPTATASPTPASLILDRIVLRNDNPRFPHADGRLAIWAKNIDPSIAQRLAPQLRRASATTLEVTDGGAFAVRLLLGNCVETSALLRCTTFDRGAPQVVLVLRQGLAHEYQLTILVRRLSLQQTGNSTPVGPVTVRLSGADEVSGALSACANTGALLRCRSS